MRAAKALLVSMGVCGSSHTSRQFSKQLGRYSDAVTSGHALDRYDQWSLLNPLT
jgi:hypothetical protein